MPPSDRTGPTDLPSGVVIRRARTAEAARLTDVFISVRRENLGAIPALVHDADSVRNWVATVLLAHQDVWVVEQDATVVGLLALQPPDRLEHLYLMRSATGQGIGSALLEVARRELGGAVQLWTFQSNSGARRFYERHGFRVVEMTDGDNEEGAPDVRYLWDPTAV